MTKDEMKNRISMALTDPILQQGFEIICKNLAKLESRNDNLVKMYNEMVERQNSSQQSLYKDLAELEAQIEKMKCCENCKYYKPCVTVDETIGNECEDFYNGCNNSVIAPFGKWEIKENE